jgi:poly(3-hydroxybutyrate) depolymerase
MMHRSARLVSALAAAVPLALGCTNDAELGGDGATDEPGGDDTGSGGGGGGGGDGDAGPAISFACPAGITLASGPNTLTIGNLPRTLLADFPADMSKPIGVVFSWHGYMQTAEAFRTEAALDPNINPDQPVVVITPNDTDMVPPFGLGWDLVQGSTNLDFALFEATLGCLNAQYTIDPKAIYSFGFSAGAVMTSLLHSSYPKLIATIAVESGAWFNDPAQRSLVTIPLVPWDWPALDPADGGTVLLTHGGQTDVTVANIMSLEAAAQAAVPYLTTNQRVVVDCAHDGGHVLDPNVPRDTIVTFLTGHRTGEAPDPAASAVLPASCHTQLP